MSDAVSAVSPVTSSTTKVSGVSESSTEEESSTVEETQTAEKKTSAADNVKVSKKSQVKQLDSQGASVSQIAAKLSMSEDQVEEYLSTGSESSATSTAASILNAQYT